jgi:hypothetical protein
MSDFIIYIIYLFLKYLLQKHNNLKSKNLASFIKLHIIMNRYIDADNFNEKFYIHETLSK